VHLIREKRTVFNVAAACGTQTGPAKWRLSAAMVRRTSPGKRRRLNCILASVDNDGGERSRHDSELPAIKGQWINED